MAACVNRAPEGLLGAAVADVGVLDLLKASAPCFIPTITSLISDTRCSSRISPSVRLSLTSYLHPGLTGHGHRVLVLGRAWTSDYGDPHDPHDFDFIYPISPLHNIPTDKVLPPLLLTTADRGSCSPQSYVRLSDHLPSLQMTIV